MRDEAVPYSYNYLTLTRNLNEVHVNLTGNRTTKPRASSLLPLLLLAAFFSSTAPADAAWISVTPERDGRYTDITTRCSSLPYDVHVVIRRKGRKVFERRMEDCASRVYTWRCKRTGRHTWVATGRGRTRRGSFTVPTCQKPFVSKRKARRLIRQLVYQDARNKEYEVTALSIYNCRYGRTGTWNRRRWLCDVTLEWTAEGRARRTYCGWGRVVKVGRIPDVAFSTTPYTC